MKTFITDKQTLEDLNIFGKKAGNSVYALFNQTHTRGGAEALEQLFQVPLADKEAINRRSATFRHFQSAQTPFPFAGEWLDVAEKYLEDTDERSKLSSQDNTLGRKFNQLLGADNPFQLLSKGVTATLSILTTLKTYIHTAGASPLDTDTNRIKPILAGISYEAILAGQNPGKLSFEQIAALDQLFRFTHGPQLKQLLQYIYQLDVYLTVANVAAKRNFVYATALDQHSASAQVEGVYHPLVDKAKGNTIRLNGEQNVFFLTGANMAGKSTLMKSLGIAVYLAHMGFPVPAVKMEFAVMDGMFTTINLADNLDMGYSHFYAEVNRVKKVAQLLAQKKKLFVIFDELFRGTNVKDAYEATVAVTEAFATRHSSLFMISSHILEAGETLKRSPAIQFACLTTELRDNKPVYTYLLRPGLSADRHGMIIVREEGILDLLQYPQKSTSQKGFVTDKQTLDDLNLLGKYKHTSVFSIFNRTQTSGGEKLLEQLFREPLTDATAINERSNILFHFSKLSLAFPVDADLLNEAEDFLKMGNTGSRLQTLLQRSRNLAMKYMGLPKELEQVKKGLAALCAVIKDLRDFHLRLKLQAPEHPFLKAFAPAAAVLEDARITGILEKNATGNLLEIAGYDHLFRNVLANDIKALFHIAYQLDVYLSVAAVGKEKKWHYAQALPAAAKEIRLLDFHHPAIQNGITNSLTANGDQPLVFLTGANMAGKSTLMKAYGIAVYLAHMGFPVAAKEMIFSVKDGMYTSINVPDNLKEGYSHFYAEVLRVKMIAAEVSRSGNLLIIFDELFKGTNVKDAYDATLAVTSALAGHRGCVFMISTHITEVGASLKTDLEKEVQFVFLPTVMNGHVPTYPRKLATGISADRHGMMIIENEGILDIIRPVATA
ncbi:MutS-related protein [Chitinophaga arvensicola]|uniref:MutS domain III n=1 Tax=Chitinophaga arvensicola TaxID=29529 RepID=A0A1I0NL80_9BACT|nr:hypothetical protein [Chitinophaga arvensicola]SEW02082.1 MutS domain III [Chitinophaga arvensicola]